MATVLIDDVATSSTSAVLSDSWPVDAGAVSSCFLIHSSAVAGTAVVQVNMGGSAGWQDVVTGESVTAGEVHAVVVDIPGVRLRLEFTPSAATASTLRVIAAAAGQK